MATKILTLLSIMILLTFSLGCNYSATEEGKSDKNEYKTLAQSIESYILSNECGILIEENSCLAGITTKSRDDHSKCGKSACKEDHTRNKGELASP